MATFKIFKSISVTFLAKKNKNIINKPIPKYKRLNYRNISKLKRDKDLILTKLIEFIDKGEIIVVLKIVRF